MTTRTTPGVPRAILAVIAAAVAAIALLAGCASSTPHPARTAGSGDHAALTSQQAPATARHTFDPYTASGRLTVAVTRRTSGSCFSTSIADPTGSAYRCFAGNQILDPCFARPGTGKVAKGGTVACVADPWSKATVLTLTKALPGRTTPEHRVWAFLRSDGARCVAATGTVPAVAGRNLAYNCTDHTAAALNSTSAKHVRTVFAKVGATSLRSGTVRELWHS
ncbi:hypothetical protein [Jatrophihabitans endophyticus]|uniref:hypothetical protein n=1 Tax=Jatrophihabitans endophyticus TaxID=1206085 RepID=UPI0019DEF726|nr:hypothetical protein [Jatrophihabitans endophyticus]MBE7187257.1 hypothetical protein [Jatrophihabitans endophyticus]